MAAAAATITGTPMASSPTSPVLLRDIALAAALAGAAGSLAFMLRAGHRNSSLMLLALFTIWVLSPWVALVLAWVKSPGRLVLILMPALAVGCLAVYGWTMAHPPRKAAAVFLLVPAASWLLMGAVAIAAAISGRRSLRG